MASRRRAAEDKNTKLLRELAAIPANKQCFDCLQRGPTYINVTIGSYVCTTCSGILRGLTPPHRVKSISMTTFTPDEIEHLKSRGNEYCKYVWLGTFDTSTNSIESEVSDDQKKRDFMVQKYEKKRWYVDPDIAVKKLQCDLLQRQKQGIAQPQNYIRSSVPETQPLSRLLGKSPTPLVVQNNQNTEIWPHPVSSASAPTISTKTSAQNHGSRSIDLLSEFAANASASTNKAVNNSTANGNFANFDSAFTSVEKSASSTGPPPATNLPSSASLDAYPMPRQLPQIPVTAFSPPLPTSVTTSTATTSVQSNADRYAALADLDSLFHQPTSTKAPSWTVETTSTVSMHDVPVASDKSINTSSAAPSNPFASTDLWSQSVKPSFQSANPFQTGTDGLSYSQISSSQAYAPFPIPMVGNSPSDDNVRNQFNANYSFPTQMVTSPSNGYGTSQMLLQNGGIVSPTSGSGSWNMPTNMPMWSSSQLGLGGLFSSENKSAETAQHSDWIQNPVNPFMVSSNSTGFPVAPKNNCSNPFL